jgi:hypothetical protein
MRLILGSIELLEFRPMDVTDLFRIRNDESVRSFMTDPRPIAFAAHEQWVAQHLFPGGSLLLLLARKNAVPIGFTLLKMLDTNTVEFGAIFCNAQRYPIIPGQAATIMAYLGYDYYGFPWAKTYVRPEHMRAIDLNRGLGGIEVESDRPGMICFHSPRATVLDNPRYRKLMARIAAKMIVRME